MTLNQLPEGNPSVLLELIPFELAPVGADLYNSTLREGFVPALLKSAIVHPLSKVTRPSQVHRGRCEVNLSHMTARLSAEGFHIS